LQLNVGGSGGSSGNGGDVAVTNTGMITTAGAAGYGVYAQSVGGGGGAAGNINRGLGKLDLAKAARPATPAAAAVTAAKLR
jgi:hypothetical protein